MKSSFHLEFESNVNYPTFISNSLPKPGYKALIKVLKNGQRLTGGESSLLLVLCGGRRSEGKVWVRGLGEAFLSLHLSRRVYLGTSPCCVRLANTQGARVNHQKPAAKNHGAAVASLGTGSTLSRCAVPLPKLWLHCHWHALLLRTACQASRPCRVNRQQLGRQLTCLCSLWLESKRHYIHRICKLFKHVFRSWEFEVKAKKR